MNRWDCYNELYHYGKDGMHWGIRKYQNEDGSLTELGRIHYGYKSKKEDNRHEEKVNAQKLRQTKEEGCTERHTNNTKYGMKKVQLSQDKVKRGANSDKYKHEEEIARINSKDKALSEKLKYKDNRAKEKAKSEEQKRQYQLEKLRAKTAREDMNRYHDETKREQVQDYRFGRHEQNMDYKTTKMKNTAKIIGAAAIGIGSALVLKQLSQNPSFGSSPLVNIDSRSITDGRNLVFSYLNNPQAMIQVRR